MVGNKLSGNENMEVWRFCTYSALGIKEKLHISVKLLLVAGKIEISTQFMEDLIAVAGLST